MEQENVAEECYDLSFLAEKALDAQRPFSVQEQKHLALVHQALHDADVLLVCLGGKAGRLGECVVGSALLEGVLQAVLFLRGPALPVYISVDEGVVQLFDQHLYRQHYWSEINVIAAAQPPTIDSVQNVVSKDARYVLTLDFHGAHDGMPSIIQRTFRRDDTACRSVLLTDLFRVGIRHYSRRGPARRYADFITELFGLPHAAIEGTLAQPVLYLSRQEIAGYADLLESLQVGAPTFPVVCFFQSMVLAKCYERWDEVMHLFSQYVAKSVPQQTIDFIIACGPDGEQPPGFKRDDIVEWFQDFQDEHENVRVHVVLVPSLRELAVITSQARVVLSNDTGPGHIAGALAVPVIVPYLPGDLYSMRVWASSLWHHGVTLDEHVYSRRELESAILWGRTEIIDSIAPDMLFHTLLSHLPNGTSRQG